ncbi:Plasmodium variant antigen protein Cir/Yir/Bir/Plasmodium vivax Vir protein, putative [Plasmodium ovale]|uniref:Plasmodium variant antigen protein Cir/Yir/Bir/Plasmodium vivax Vir protein, putative n=1 Tax=Plasmodium ovale TaxID=36330 RepID=A0A1C3KGA9_PLAOA|nr:Plasmodium variant antigen protein Cir/Yir/Bir/Plasmodium vivax Vir protein, putative [Plasmodium ovale]
MVCDPASYKKKYAFFNFISEYIENDELAEKNGDNSIPTIDYSFINIFNEQKFDDLKKLCSKFVYLVDALRKRNQDSTFNADYDFDYLNYWLNARIHEIDPDSICKKQFFQYLRSKSSSINSLSELSSGIYDIKENDLNDMNTLYKLYKIFKELNKLMNATNPHEGECMSYAHQYVNMYKELEKKCTGNKPKFCDNINKLKQEYEKINLCEQKFAKWSERKLPPLTGDDNPSIKACNDRTTSLYVNGEQPSLGKVDSVETNSDIDVQNFTSFGPWIRSRIIKNEDIFENLGEGMNHFSHTSEYDNLDSENTSYNIAYNNV